MSNKRILRTESLEEREVPAASNLFAIGGGVGGTPRVQVFDTVSGVKLADFLAYEATFTGGVSTAIADVNSDGFVDLIVGAGVGGGPRVRVFDGKAFSPGRFGQVAPLNGTSFLNDQFVLADFFAFESTQRGGTYVAAGNFTGTAFAEVVVGAGPGGGPRVRILDGQAITTQGRNFTSDRNGDTVANFFAYESTFRNGVTVTASPAPLTAAFSDLVVAPGLGGGPRVRVLSGNVIGTQKLQYTSFGSGDAAADFFAGDSTSRTGVFVASADYNRDGVVDIAVSAGPGGNNNVTIYSGSAIQLQRTNFNGGQAGDVLDTFGAGNGSTAGVTVGSALEVSGLTNGLLLIGTGGNGATGRAQLVRFLPGNGFLTRQVVQDITFDPNFTGGVFVSG